MVAKLNERGLRRLVPIYGLNDDIIVILTQEGITFKAPGTKLGAQATWSQLVGVCTLPESVHKKFVNPFEFLRSQTKEHQKRMVKRLANRS